MWRETFTKAPQLHSSSFLDLNPSGKRAVLSASLTTKTVYKYIRTGRTRLLNVRTFAPDFCRVCCIDRVVLIGGSFYTPLIRVCRFDATCYNFECFLVFPVSQKNVLSSSTRLAFLVQNTIPLLQAAGIYTAGNPLWQYLALVREYDSQYQNKVFHY